MGMKKDGEIMVRVNSEKNGEKFKYRSEKTFQIYFKDYYSKWILCLLLLNNTGSVMIY